MILNLSESAYDYDLFENQVWRPLTNVIVCGVSDKPHLSIGVHIRLWSSSSQDTLRLR